MEGKTIFGIGAAVILLVGAIVVYNLVCTVIPPGYVGIIVNLSGSDRGVEHYPVLTGRQFYNPMNNRIYEYPAFLQTVTWTKDPKEGATHDQSITFNSSEGATVNVDISFAYMFVPDKVPDIFVQFRKEPQEITDTYMRAKVRDAFSREASKMKIADIYGSSKEALLNAVKKDLKDELEPMGFYIDTVTMVGALRLDENVKNSINVAIQAQQEALAAVNKVAQSKAEADQKQAEADGESYRITKIAQANADANNLLTKSITPQLVQYQAMEKWNGVLPQVTGSGGMPFIQLNSPPK